MFTASFFFLLYKEIIFLSLVFRAICDGVRISLFFILFSLLLEPWQGSVPAHPGFKDVPC